MCATLRGDLVSRYPYSCWGVGTTGKFTKSTVFFILSGEHSLTKMDAIVTPFIGYAVFEGDITNVSRLELKSSMDVSDLNKTMWPGGLIY